MESVQRSVSAYSQIWAVITRVDLRTFRTSKRYSVPAAHDPLASYPPLPARSNLLFVSMGLPILDISYIYIYSLYMCVHIYTHREICMHNAVTNSHVQRFVWTHAFIPLGHTPKVELLGQTGTVCLTTRGAAHGFPTWLPFLFCPNMGI